jgi:hypothetical protein
MAGPATSRVVASKIDFNRTLAVIRTEQSLIPIGLNLI